MTGPFSRSPSDRVHGPERARSSLASNFSTPLYWGSDAQRPAGGGSSVVELLPSKQVVAGSIPVPRSTDSRRAPAVDLVFPNSTVRAPCTYGSPVISTLTDAIAAYRVLAQAEGSSPKTISWVTESAHYLDRFLGEGTPLAQVTAHEVRRWIAALRERPRFGVGGGGQGIGRNVSPTTINTYVRGV